ncbi:uncharacterized protein EAE97_002381 [Botrytis byssoidea]|uniref:Uncharacterized protein n=1 Tax=Botrytis byssoidea TaxID=139641 RepID=A0A9P5IVC7_9HELO|nr:uncharacterized protein EAE97_002381 [Botrytis byssoidea]KAF7950829.1 hypothetical protein EAE97_002381 [Botrytis byssoidea]
MCEIYSPDICMKGLIAQATWEVCSAAGNPADWTWMVAFLSAAIDGESCGNRRVGIAAWLLRVVCDHSDENNLGPARNFAVTAPGEQPVLAKDEEYPNLQPETMIITFFMQARTTDSGPDVYWRVSCRGISCFSKRTSSRAIEALRLAVCCITFMQYDAAMDNVWTG